MSDSVRPQRRQPTRLPRPWDSPGKNTGVGCHFLLQCMKLKSESEVAESCPILSDPMDCGPPGSSVHGIFHARVLEWGAIAFSLHIHILLRFPFFEYELAFADGTQQYCWILLPWLGYTKTMASILHALHCSHWLFRGSFQVTATLAILTQPSQVT